MPSKSSKRTVVIIDDDPICQHLIEKILTKVSGFNCLLFASGKEAVSALSRQDIQAELIFLDVIMPEMDGFATFKAIRSLPRYEQTPIIFITAVTDQETIQRCFAIGGNDYIGKPIRETELIARFNLHRGLLRQYQVVDELEKENLSLQHRLLSRGKLEHPEAFSAILTVSPQMHTIFQYVEAISKTSRPVFITGETGTGKELIAKVIHQLSNRPGHFVPLNVAGLDDNLFSDTLFGHVKGAFTGAIQDRPGLIEEASEGTLFLDEIGDLDMLSQVKLLRLLQEGEYYPLGSDQRKFSDARIIVATHQNIPKLVEEGKFRKDLFYRLRTHHVHIPPLRQRKCDLPILTEHFVKQAAATLHRPPPKIPKGLVELLYPYDFPGNIRELEGLIFDAVSCTLGNELSIDTFRETLAKHRNDSYLFTDSSPHESDSITENSISYGSSTLLSLFSLIPDAQFPSLRQIVDLAIQEALNRTHGNQSEAAKLLGLTRQALNKRIRRSKENIVCGEKSAGEGDDSF